MSTQDLLALIGALCALLMVIGSLLLLYRGTITLEQANPQDAIKLEFQKVLNLQTRYPALGLFIVGIAFLAVSYWYEQNNGVKDAELQGMLQTDNPGDAIAEFVSSLGEAHVDSGNYFRKKVPSNLEEVEVTVRETGYEPYSTAVHPNQTKKGTVSFKVNLTKKLDKPQTDPSQVLALPAGLPPLQ